MISTDIARLDRSAAFAHKYVSGYFISLCSFICILFSHILAFGLARYRLVLYIISTLFLMAYCRQDYYCSRSTPRKCELYLSVPHLQLLDH